MNVYENLINEKKDFKLYEEAKEKIELRDCTFQPGIDKKSEQMAQK